jgi:integrase
VSRRPVGSIRKRRDEVYRVELTSGFDPITGKRRRMSEDVHGSELDAERVLAKMLLDIGRMPSGGNLTVREYVENLFEPWLASRVRKVTRHGYQSKLDLHVLPKLGEVPLRDLEPYVLDRWRDELLEKMSGRSALHVYRVFANALNRAVRWRLIPANPLDAVDPPRAKVRDLDTLTADEALGYLRAFEGHVLEPLVIVAIATGLRPCELYALTWQDIDLQAGEVRVHRGLHERKGEVWFEDPKSDRSHRVVSLPEWAVVSLASRRGLGPLTPHAGGYMPPTMVSRLYRAHTASSSLRHVPLRDLRHTHATLMLEAGVDLVVVSRRLGHSTVAITDQHYLRPKRSADQAAAQAFDAMLATVGGKGSQATVGDTTVGRNG